MKLAKTRMKKTFSWNQMKLKQKSQISIRDLKKKDKDCLFEEIMSLSNGKCISK